MGDHLIPVRNLHREMDRRHPRRVSGIGGMDFRAADPQLQLPFIELRATVQKFRTQHLLVPLPGALAIADLDIDVLD
jgi:hypothetical protein